MQPYCRSAELRNGFPVGDQDQRLILYLPGKSFQQLPFRFFIQGRSRFIQQEDASGAEQAAGNCNPDEGKGIPRSGHCRHHRTVSGRN
ncbi:hypothetical protein [Phocaeicola coprophilus]|uniref:hypothetical protein n=1 Tax=Phocaeicola coprophilus TaxID=387090 RepID=UPI0040283CAF